MAKRKISGYTPEQEKELKNLIKNPRKGAIKELANLWGKNEAAVSAKLSQMKKKLKSGNEEESSTAILKGNEIRFPWKSVRIEGSEIVFTI